MIASNDILLIDKPYMGDQTGRPV